MELTPSKSAKKVWDSVQLYTVKCGKCSKWRLVPSKEKYEEIREIIAEKPFSCETAREWRPQISCDDEPDIEQDVNMRWAMDKPSIPKTPPGWQRILRVRAEGGTKFADVYYVSPSNKRLRSTVEISRYFSEHPKYLEEGLDISQFSFQSPVAMDEYVARRRSRTAYTNDDTGIVPFAVNPISSAAPYKKLKWHSGVPESASAGAPQES